eukprot:scaffold101403_cov62-Phaeocystis_antarctica.AAC.3
MAGGGWARAFGQCGCRCHHAEMMYHRDRFSLKIVRWFAPVPDDLELDRVHALARIVMEPPAKKRCPHSTTAPELTLGAPRTQAASGRYVTKGGVTVDRLVKPLADPSEALEGLIDQLDQERGCVFQSSYEVPGRYARWTMGFVNPPLAFEGWGRRFTITALNKPNPNP